MKYARNVGNVAVDVRAQSPDGCFTPDLAAQFVEVPDAVQNGWVWSGSTWIAPIVPEPVPVQTTPFIPPKVSPVQFKLLFTSLERIAIKAACSTDAVLSDAYDLLNDLRLTHVDLSLKSNIGMIDYMQGLGLIEKERSESIKRGIIL